MSWRLGLSVTLVVIGAGISAAHADPSSAGKGTTGTSGGKAATEGAEKGQTQDSSPWQTALSAAFDRGDTAQAERKYLESIKVEKASKNPNWRRITMSMNNLAEFYVRHKKIDKAVALRKESLKIVDKEVGRKSLEGALMLNSLAALSLHKQDWNAAEAYSKEAAEIADQVLPAKNPQLRNFYNNLGYILEHNGNTQQAQAMYEKSVANEGEVEVSDIPMSQAMKRLAGIHERNGKLDEALKFYKKSVFTLATHYYEDDPSLARCQHAMGDIYIKQGKYPEAEAQYYNAVLAYCKTKGNTKAEVEKACDDSVNAFKRSNKKERADRVLDLKRSLIASIEAKSAEKQSHKNESQNQKSKKGDQN